jgi:hypothetical protein
MSRKIERYYRSEAHLAEILRSLPLTACPFCYMTGALIRHGLLETHGESTHAQKQGQRIICTVRRKQNRGCGRTFSIISANRLKNFCITAQSLWRFLIGFIKKGIKATAFSPLTDRFHPSSAYRLWKKFSQAQSRIRSFLTRHSPRPRLGITPCAATQTIAHLSSVFKNHPCPIAAFQERYQESFL